MVVNLEHPEDYDSEAVKAQALANAQSAFMKHEETVHSHSSDKYRSCVFLSAAQVWAHIHRFDSRPSYSLLSAEVFLQTLTHF